MSVIFENKLGLNGFINDAYAKLARTKGHHAAMKEIGLFLDRKKILKSWRYDPERHEVWTTFLDGETTSSMLSWKYVPKGWPPEPKARSATRLVDQSAVPTVPARWTVVLADAPEYRKMPGPELLLVGRIAAWGGHPVGHPEKAKWGCMVQMENPWLPVTEPPSQRAFDELRGSRPAREINGARVLIKAKLRRDRSMGKYPIVVVGSIRGLRGDEQDWKMPWLVNLPLLPPEREIFSIPLVIACEAETAADSALGYSGVRHARQRFKIVEVFHGEASIGRSIDLGYSYLQRMGRDIDRGEKVIWVCTGPREEMSGYGAVPDTPRNRQEARRLAERVKARPPQTRRDLLDLGFDRAEVSTALTAEVPDLFIRSASGSESYELRRDVQIVYSGPDGAVYFAAAKKVYYVRRDVYGPTGPSSRAFFGPFAEDPSLIIPRRDTPPTAP